MKNQKDKIPYPCTRCKRNCPFEIRILVIKKSECTGTPINPNVWCKLFERMDGK